MKTEQTNSTKKEKFEIFGLENWVKDSSKIRNSLKTYAVTYFEKEDITLDDYIHFINTTLFTIYFETKRSIYHDKIEDVLNNKQTVTKLSSLFIYDRNIKIVIEYVWPVLTGETYYAATKDKYNVISLYNREGDYKKEVLEKSYEENFYEDPEEEIMDTTDIDEIMEREAKASAKGLKITKRFMVLITKGKVTTIEEACEVVAKEFDISISTARKWASKTTKILKENKHRFGFYE